MEIAAPRTLPFLLGFWLALGACEGDRSPAAGPPLRDPNLVIVTLDTTRADHLGTYGYFRATSPRFDEVARESLVFDRVLAPMATTLPSHLSIFTSTYPIEHGVLANLAHGRARFDPAAKLRTLASVAQDAGYQTAAFVSGVQLNRGSGVADGFDTFDEPALGARAGPSRGPLGSRAGAETVDAALVWIAARDPGRPYLLWVHFFDAHWPYDRIGHEGFARAGRDEGLEAHVVEREIPDRALRPLVGHYEDSRDNINHYDGELLYQDAQLGRLLDVLRREPDWGKTVLIVLSDHGEGLGQHGETAHGGTWEEHLRMAVVIRAPGQAPRRVGTLMSAVDLLPTLLGLIDAPALDELLDQSSGSDVLARDFSPRPVFGQDSGRKRGSDYRYSLTSKDWKYVRIDRRNGSTTHELYDLREDPFELNEVSAGFPEVVARLNAVLEEEIAEQERRGHRFRSPSQPRSLPADPELIERLEALGYVDGGEPSH